MTQHKPERRTLLPLQITYKMVQGLEKENTKALGEEPVFMLMGKTEEGESLVCEVSGFFPYFYVELPTGLEKKEACQWHALLKTLSPQCTYSSCEVVRRQTIYGYAEKQQSFLKVAIKNPRNMNSARSEVETLFKSTGLAKVAVFEANIGFITRFMVDKEMVGMGYVEVEGTMKGGVMRLTSEHIRARNDLRRLPPLKILSFDLECVGREGKFPSAKIDPVVQIGNAMSHYPHADIREKVLFCLKDTNPITDVTIYSFETEAELLMAWSRWVVSIDPDVITGWNISGFDFPYLLGRAEALGLPEFKHFGRTTAPVTIKTTTSVTAAFGTRENKIVTIDGRLVFDMLDIVKREFRLNSYSLNNVSSLFLGEEKEDVHYTQIAPLFHASSETRKRLGMYCMKDAYLPMRILFTKNLLVNYCELARVTGVPFDYLVNRGQGIRVLSQLLRKARSSGYLLPVIMGGEETYEGGYVMEPEKGFYQVPVIVLDFMSLYPSIIMAYNLCYTTLIEPGREKEMQPDEYVRSPSGDCFVTPKVRAGILPSILAHLLDSRKAAKKELALATDAEMKMSLNAKQLALKISANSVYGFTGASKTGLPCIPISRSVTAFGRTILKDTKTSIEERFRPTQALPLSVIYGDTDSVMVTGGAIGLPEAFETGEKISAFVTKEFPHPLVLAFEKVYFPFLLMNKKRYAGCSISAPGAPGTIDTKGIETVRRDNCGLVRSLMQTCLKEVFLKNNVEGAKEAIRKTVKNLGNNNVGIGQLVISKSISKKEEGYAVHLAHVELAERMRQRNPDTAPGVGDRVSYVIVKGQGPLHARSEDPSYVLEHNLPIDTDYYLENQVKKPIQRLLEPVIENVDALLTPPADSVSKHTVALPSTKSIGTFFKKKSLCLICRMGPSPVCRSCEPQYPAAFKAALKELSFLQYKYFLLLSECQRMQHSTHTPILCCNRDCHIFYMRKELTKQVTEAQRKYDQLRLFVGTRSP
ncbi:DNA polymerase delta subunit 1 [Nematocida displodere]|uniref:DNA polymerase n=1 Tax=Nematocida displodere TaxID=1805483 RepID=A0A177EKF3_9MICR|nr:DNA polymerase delta subunit 1 [Nematocida displodere]